MAFGAMVQDPVGVYTAASSTTVVKAFTSNVTAGNIIAVFVDAPTTTATATCADSLNGAHTNAIGPTVNATFGFSAWIFYFLNSAGGACTVTVTFSTALADKRMKILEYEGSAAAVLGVTAGATGNDDTPSSGSNTTTVDNSLIFGGLLHGNPGTVTPGSGFNTLRAGADVFTCAEDKVLATAGSVAANYTTVTGNQWIALMATFHVPTVVVPLRLTRFF